MAVEYILLILFIFMTSYFVVGKWNGKRQPVHRYPPSLPSLPFIGSLPFLRNVHNISEFFMKKSDELGPIFTFRVGNKLVVTLNNKEVIDEALVKNSRSFSTRPDLFMQTLVNPKHRGIAFRKNDAEGKIIHQSSLSILREFGFGDKNIMESRILREAEEMIEYGKRTRGKSFDPKELSFLMTSNIILSISFGSRLDYDLGISEIVHESDRYTRYMNILFDIAPFVKFIPPFNKQISALKDCDRKIHDLVEEEIDKSLRNQEICFVSEYIKREGPNYDREQLIWIVREFIVGGVDTTANTMRWSFVAFGNHQEIQKQLQEDIDSVIPRDRLPSLQDQAKLPYVEATILELYRWRTLVPLSVAHSVEHDSLVKNFFIPAGTLVLPNLYAAHTNTYDWKDPDVFRPERFLDDEGRVIGRDRIIPFSHGKRSCLGEILARAEIFLFLTALLQRFSILPPEGEDKVCDQYFQPVDIVIVPKALSIRLLDRQ